MPLITLMMFGLSAFFCIIILFGNLNAMAMRSLGQIAGLGASLVASKASLVATLYALASVVSTMARRHLAIAFLIGRRNWQGEATPRRSGCSIRRNESLAGEYWRRDQVVISNWCKLPMRQLPEAGNLCPRRRAGGSELTLPTNPRVDA